MRLIFSEWRKTIITAKIEDTIASFEWFKENAISGVKVAAAIAARDDIRDIKATTNQTNPVSEATTHYETIRKPKKVATPFPPLNLSQIG